MKYHDVAPTCSERGRDGMRHGGLRFPGACPLSAIHRKRVRELLKGGHPGGLAQGCPHSRRLRVLRPVMLPRRSTGSPNGSDSLPPEHTHRTCCLMALSQHWEARQTGRGDPPLRQGGVCCPFLSPVADATLLRQPSVLGQRHKQVVGSGELRGALCSLVLSCSPHPLQHATRSPGPWGWAKWAQAKAHSHWVEGNGGDKGPGKCAVP